MSRSSFSPLTCKSVMWKASWTSYKNSRASSMTVLLGVKPVHISWITWSGNTAPQIPPDYVVRHPCLRNPLDVSTRGAHHVSSAPRTTDREMRHGADRQTQTPKPHPHRRLSRSGYLLAAPGQWQGVHRVRASLHPLHWLPTPSQIDL